MTCKRAAIRMSPIIFGNFPKHFGDLLESVAFLVKSRIFTITDQRNCIPPS